MSHEPLSTIRQLELMRDLQRLANRRYEEETRLERQLKRGLQNALEEHQSARRSQESRHAEARRQAEDKLQSFTAQATAQYEKRRSGTQQEYQEFRTRVEREHADAVRAVRFAEEKARFEAWGVYEANKDKPGERLIATLTNGQQMEADLAVLQGEAVEILQMRRLWRETDEAAGTLPPSSGTPSGSAGKWKEAADFEPPLEVDPDAADTKDALPAPPALPDEDALADNVGEAAALAERLVASAREQALALYRQKLPRLFEDWHPFGAAFGVTVLCILASGMMAGWQGWWWLALGLSAAVAVNAAAALVLYPLARRLAVGQYRRTLGRIAEARSALQNTAAAARDLCAGEAKEVVQTRDRELAQAKERAATGVAQQDSRKHAQLAEAHGRYPAQLTALRRAYEDQTAAAQREFDQTLSVLIGQRDESITESERIYDERCAALRAKHDEAWQRMAEAWRQGIDQLEQSWADMRGQCERLFPDWRVTDYAAWDKPTEAAPAIAFGTVTVDLAQVKHALSDDPRLHPASQAMQLPALLELAHQPVMVLSTDGKGRAPAAELLELMMLRFLTAMPPGKVRFTVFDPVGLGENFGSFMHLADFDERLITSRIWTESKAIEEQLARLTAHMETVLQKYLRNEYPTIHEYNAMAGEVAEPFRVVVAANFPAGFSEAAARRLLSIATNGPRCGVYTLISFDHRERLPHDFRTADLFADAVHLEWQADRKQFVWRYPAFERLKLALDRPPGADRTVDVVRAAGEAAMKAARVEVPFATVAPPPDDIWQSENSRELVVPIGQAGATQKQSVRLGQGMAQHLLVCGKTGSGKSTFLHALITNTALHYGPDQVEFYLIDFKKGVEFKTYATGRLPHARVIAIESEREFGLSVLQRLDAELRRRGDLFRTHGVQDLAAFRSAQPNERMPRVLLIVDEFQELFVEDDPLAQEAALLLDRLVRQGRAFGMHVLLGSQTLSGAYSLARSTMGQMGVRVALQCSEADVHLILSDERNQAARFLNRPGEAIYNDQNGLLEGNHPFQVVWLSEAERGKYLSHVAARQHQDNGTLPPPIVFEGNEAADPASNALLKAVLEGAVPAPSETSQEIAGVQRAWVGDAVAITDPTSAAFSRHAGSNLLVVGQQEDEALGVLSAAVVALAAQSPPASERSALGAGGAEVGPVGGAAGEYIATAGAGGTDEADGEEDARPVAAEVVPLEPLVHPILVLDGSRPGSSSTESWQRVAAALSEHVTIRGPREAARIIGQAAAEVARREAAGDDGAPPLYLVLFNAGRFRELRRSDDAFGFSRGRDKAARPDEQFQEILRNGPSWGVHVLMWCDSYNNAMRILDRSSIREFEMRIVFQMSATDSSNLLDSPAASRLRPHRGLFYADDLGTIEKFRPYGPPADEWLAAVRRAMTARVEAS